MLDGAVLVISAVEGVQPQTRMIFGRCSDSRVPTLIFVNKIDRDRRDLRGTIATIASG